MNVPQGAARSPIRRRRWRVPPPLTRGGELLEGAEILEELPGEVGMLLWKALRSTTLWAGTPAAEAGRLFTPGAAERRLAELLGAEIDPVVREPLEWLAQLLAEAESTPREPVALTCRQIAQWAAARGARGTELAFMQAAAMVCPADAELAFQVGRLTRMRGEVPRAESWYRRAIMLGRQSGNWTAYARSFLGLGIAAKRRGNLPLARRSHLKALRVADRRGLRGVRAMALHELFTVSVECDDFSTAQRWADQAYHAYDPAQPDARNLAHDLCCLWMREGQFRRALGVLDRLLPLFERDLRLVPVANVARAAGGAGERDRFFEAYEEARQLLGDRPTLGTPTQALLAMARGATGIAEYDLAAEIAEEALRTAELAGESQNLFEAESVLSFARNRRAVEANVDRNRHEQTEREADRLAREMMQTFGALAGV